MAIEEMPRGTGCAKRESQSRYRPCGRGEPPWRARGSGTSSTSPARAWGGACRCRVGGIRLAGTIRTRRSRRESLVFPYDIPFPGAPCSRSTAMAVRIRMRLVPRRPFPTAPWRGPDRSFAAWILACCSRCRILQRPNPATGWLTWMHGRNSGGFPAWPDPCPACIHITDRSGGWRQRLSVQ